MNVYSTLKHHQIPSDALRNFSPCAGEEALQRLQDLCRTECLDKDRFGWEAFDGSALLLLDAEKL